MANKNCIDADTRKAPELKSVQLSASREAEAINVVEKHGATRNCC